MPRPNLAHPDSAQPTPTRIVRVITRLNIGGPSIQAASLTARLAAHGFETCLVHGRLGEGEGDMSYLLPPGADAVYLPALQRPLAPGADLRAVRQVYRVLCRVRPAIVHTHMAKAGMAGRLAALWYNRTVGRGRPARVVHTYHGHVLDGYFGPFKSSLFIQIERALARVTDRLIAISPAIRGELVGHYRIGRDAQYATVPLGFDLDAFAAMDDRARREARASLDLPADAEVVSTVGRLTAIKQHDLFLDMAREVARRRPRAVFLIVGDGELRAELEARAHAVELAGRVRFLGWRRDLATIYGATDVFALTSRNEGTPVALIEAMAAGVPGVSTDVGGVRDVIVSEAAGARVPPGDPAGLAGAVAGLLDDPARRRAAGDAARAEVLTRYGIGRLVDDIAGLYRELLAPGG